MLKAALTDTLATLDQVIAGHRAEPVTREIGTVHYIGHGIARLVGLPGVEAEELVRFPGGLLGIAFNLDEDEIGVVLLGQAGGQRAGGEVRRTGRMVDVPVGEALLGRVVDALGQPLDGLGKIVAWERRPVERPAVPILDRAPVTVPLETGLKAVDAFVPIGRGQRELIVGDRQTGKTAVVLDTIINQKDKDVVCVYCAIGQRGSAVARLIADLRQHGSMPYTVVVVAGGEDPPGLQFIAPYGATTIAEYFMERGQDVLVVYDDLTRHARAYRELSLLLRRPPGREAYPGDIFYIHSRLLERSAHLAAKRGGGSLTALPIVETQAQNLAAYIPTNLISITDGQICLTPTLFQKGILPALDVGRSVSRVGGRTQLPAYRQVASELRLAYTQFEEVEIFARFGTRLDERTRQAINRGRRVRAVLQQPQFAPVPVAEQITLLICVTIGLFDALPVEQMGEAEQVVRRAVAERLPELCCSIQAGQTVSAAERQTLLDVARQALTQTFGAGTDSSPGPEGG